MERAESNRPLYRSRSIWTTRSTKPSDWQPRTTCAIAVVRNLMPVRSWPAGTVGRTGTGI